LAKQSMISIVDDDQSFRESLSRLLRSLGYAVSVFPSAIEFLASPKIAATACLIADVHMPEITGVELYKQLIRTKRAIPTILVTAYPDDRVEKQMLASGVECYLRKPLEEAHLINCLCSIFERSKAP
jgi:FixJ family two-component response regulator